MEQFVRDGGVRGLEADVDFHFGGWRGTALDLATDTENRSRERGGRAVRGGGG